MVQGNKYNRALHPAMLTDAGLVKTTKVALLNKPRSSQEYVVVVYDRTYAVYWLNSKVIKPLFNLEIADIIRLVKEAWKLGNNPKISQLELDAKVDGKIQG